MLWAVMLKVNQNDIVVPINVSNYTSLMKISPSPLALIVDPSNTNSTAQVSQSIIASFHSHGGQTQLFQDETEMREFCRKQLCFGGVHLAGPIPGGFNYTMTVDFLSRQQSRYFVPTNPGGSNYHTAILQEIVETAILQTLWPDLKDQWSNASKTIRQGLSAQVAVIFYSFMKRYAGAIIVLAFLPMVYLLSADLVFEKEVRWASLTLSSVLPQLMIMLESL